MSSNIFSPVFFSCRMLCRVFANSLCPSDLVKAQKLDKSSTGWVRSRIHHWKEDRFAKAKLNSRPIPQTLSVNADMLDFANCNSETGPVLSWLMSKSFLTTDKLIELLRKTKPVKSSHWVYSNSSVYCHWHQSTFPSSLIKTTYISCTYFTYPCAQSWL